MLIAQISDVHSGPMFKDEVFHTAIEEINDLAPDAVLVTGDLTENGLMSEFTRIAEEFKRLKVENIIYVSGNHDYRSTGYLLFRHFFPFAQVTEIGDVAIVVLSSARPDRDDGEVGNRQNLWLEETLVRLKDKVTIVAIHHHVVPVPDTGADEITIIDAGDVLRSLTKSRVNLVLSGHRHRPWKWTVEKMQLVHAGSVSCEKLRGFFCNSYNVIQIKDRRIIPKLKIVGGGYLDFREIIRRREVIHASDVSQFAGPPF